MRSNSDKDCAKNKDHACDMKKADQVLSRKITKVFPNFLIKFEFCYFLEGK